MLVITKVFLIAIGKQKTKAIMYKISNFIEPLWNQAMEQNVVNIISLLVKNKNAVVLDVGCGDGKFTFQFKQKIGCRKIVGIEGDKQRIIEAKRNGINEIVDFDLEKKWPFPDKSFDVIISNQVIEHIVDLDLFISEIYRLLKPGGYCVISTENLASWHNIGALFLGYQDFSHHLISKKHVGNPLSIHYGEKTGGWGDKITKHDNSSIYPHIKIATYISLINIFKAYNFIFNKGKASGYYPLFGFLSTFASSIDPYHSHFITIKMVKPKK
ncbi:MAG: class I SAM-dependent methyltransferase [Candidatus Parcubacteria bacterium]|nr:class I SAM-dependent methyltransferase [Candidatus Parcubacteria bacterium]